MTHSMTTYLPSQLTLSTHPVNTPCQCATVFRELGDSLNVNIPTLSSYLINTPYQYTLSTHPINTPCQCATVFRELGDSLNDNIPTLSSYLINTPNQHTLSTPPLILLLAYNTLYRYQKTLPYPPPCTNPLYQNPN